LIFFGCGCHYIHKIITIKEERIADELSKLSIADAPPTTEKKFSLDLSGVAELLKSGQIKNIIVMCGAGISTAAGIPDFR
jgi:hypothetical protein